MWTKQNKKQNCKTKITSRTLCILAKQTLLYGWAWLEHCSKEETDYYGLGRRLYRSTAYLLPEIVFFEGYSRLDCEPLQVVQRHRLVTLPLQDVSTMVSYLQSLKVSTNYMSKDSSFKAEHPASRNKSILDTKSKDKMLIISAQTMLWHFLSLKIYFISKIYKCKVPNNYVITWRWCTARSLFFLKLLNLLQKWWHSYQLPVKRVVRDSRASALWISTCNNIFYTTPNQWGLTIVINIYN